MKEQRSIIEQRSKRYNNNNKENEMNGSKKSFFFKFQPNLNRKIKIFW
jgi:hypothetical protein